MLEAKKAADTYIVVGAYRIPINREKFKEWERTLMLQVGFTDKEIKAEILKRLQYEKD